MILNSNKWFSLIEVVIATWIISISVFWIYKLIWENTKIINNSSNYLQSNTLFPVLEECIENKISTFTIPVNTKRYFYLNNSNYYSCQLTNSWTIIDWLEYNLSAKIIDSWSNYNNWELTIKSEWIKTQTWFYMQIKK